MTKPPLWFTVLVIIALLWNLAGLFAVVADLRLSPAAIAALPAEQQALYAARPIWSVVASVVAVAAGTLGCLGLLLRKRWALGLLYLSLLGVVLQDIGLFLLPGSANAVNATAVVLQGIVFLVAVGLVALARTAQQRSWLS